VILSNIRLRFVGEKFLELFCGPVSELVNTNSKGIFGLLILISDEVKSFLEYFTSQLVLFLGLIGFAEESCMLNEFDVVS
jgi:hypothetical protein